ncbi:MAG TPA: glycosyltransferase family 4 protein [Candidatus Andersenbacteria bacterium]|nr:glycosyltransferase family 4 protein [Candidatus Andersenbacteria bacterium]
MRIFLPIQIKPTGGTSTFAALFKEQLEQMGHSVTFTFTKEYDILFVLVSCHPKYILHAKLHNRKIVQRLDGAYYKSTVAGKAYLLYNFPAKMILKYFATHIIYQSKYSKYSCDTFLGKPPHENWSIIYNGVDTDLFCPTGDIQEFRTISNQQIFITASRFRRRDQIIPLIQSLEIYAQKYTANFRFEIIGDFSKEVADVPMRYSHVPHLNFRGAVSRSKLPFFLRSADAFLFTHQNPPCPNNVLEALASGLPICGVADGSMMELTVPGATSELIPANDDGFTTFRKLDINRFADNLNTIMKDLPRYKNAARWAAVERFQAKRMIEEYLYAINSF